MHEIKYAPKQASDKVLSINDFVLLSFILIVNNKLNTKKVDIIISKDE